MSTRVYFNDISSALRLRELVIYRALTEIKARYNRTLIGPFWTTLSMAIFIFAFGMVGSKLWATDVAHYLPFFCAGYMAWTLISTIINESKTAFIMNKEMLNSTSVPIHVFVLELVLRNYIVFLHHLVVYALVLLIFSYPLTWAVLLVIPGFLIIFVASVSVVLLWGAACTRYRDLNQLSNNILQIFFFLTPIMWKEETLSGPTRFLLADLNPMYHFVKIIREPMLGEVPPLYSYGYTLACCAVLFLMSARLMETLKRRIVFWL